jgi:asparagine synthase (glutamine-hydrolysing)
MCGINILFNSDPEAASQILRMNEDLSHRGLRKKVRSYFGGRVMLGHVRLPIQGLSDRWDHPQSWMQWDGAFVGEVFNFKELDPEAESDLPVMLKAWEKRGVQAFRSFDGFWAAAFIDNMKKRVYVITDPLAKKPLYIRFKPLAISSEIWPLVNLGKVTPDLIYYSSVAKWGYAFDGSTPFDEIKKIPAGRCLAISQYGKMIANEQYWRWKYEEKYQVSPSVDHLRSLIKRAVERRLVSDVPVSLLLSGGLDSTIIYKLVERQTHNFTVFHIENNESEFLEELKIPSDVRLVHVIPAESVSMKDAFRANQSPVDLGSVLPQFEMGRAVKADGFKVALSGDGADELFGGYQRAQEYDPQMSDIFQELIYYHLPRLDHLMMASMVELRCPFLSTSVVDYALRIPWDFRKKKEMLKKAFKSIVPSRIIDRAKVPLKIPEVRIDRVKWRLSCIKFFREEVANYERRRR